MISFVFVGRINCGPLEPKGRPINPVLRIDKASICSIYRYEKTFGLKGSDTHRIGKFLGMETWTYTAAHILLA
jgi:hypothetical protein